MMKPMTSAVLSLALAVTAWAGHPLPLPPAPAGSLLLEAEPTPKTLPAGEDPLTMYSSSVTSDARRVETSGDARIVAHEGYQSSQMMLDYQLPNKRVAAQYQIHTAFSIGGVAPQQFIFLAGPDAQHLQPRAAFSQTNAKSWQMEWRPAEAMLTLYPGDRILRIENTGKASGRKIMDAFLLAKMVDLPADMTPTMGQLRVRLQQKPAKAERHLYVLESDHAVQADDIYHAIEKTVKLETTAIQAVFGQRSEEIAAALGIHHLPAVVVTDSACTVHGILERPADIAAAATFLATPAITVPTGRTAPPRAVAPLAQGIAPAWAVVGTWAGPGGLSLWGLDWEPRIRPSANDPEIVTAFDTVESTRWRVAESDFTGRVVLDPATRDLTWSRGSAYACLYVCASADQRVDLHIAHTGQEMRVWLDDQAVTMLPDASQLGFGSASAQAAEATVTDQGNPVEVTRGKAQPPEKATLTLDRGWHRVLVKFISQQGKNEKSFFAARFTDTAGQPAQLATSVTAPEAAIASYATLRDLVAQVQSNSPFNLIMPGDEVTLRVALARPAAIHENGRPARPGSLGTLYAGDPPVPVLPVTARLRAVVKSYDGKVLYESTAAGEFPGQASFTLGHGLPTGYYSVELAALGEDGRVIRQFPPDGFNVIGGTAAQFARREHKKMAVTYYFMAENYKDLFFPYMQRIGIYRNVGGNNGRVLEMYQTAHHLGLELAVDFWNRDAEYNRQFIQETSPFVSFYKSFNEIDIRPDQRGTPEYWVEKSKREYEMVKEFDPGAIVLGGSLVRVGNDPWFRKCVELGLEDTLDAWDVHCYPQQAPVLEGTLGNSNVESELGVIHALAKLGRATSKPFWVGETGARASHGHDARRWQADMVVKMTAWAQSRSNVPVIGFLIPWDYSRQEGTMNDIGAGHMPAEAAYYTASALIDGLGYERMETKPMIQAAKFGPTILAWCTSDAEVLKVPVAAGAEYAVVDVVGRMKSIRADSTGTIRIHLTSSPQYLLLKSDYLQLTSPPAAKLTSER